MGNFNCLETKKIIEETENSEETDGYNKRKIMIRTDTEYINSPQSNKNNLESTQDFESPIENLKTCSNLCQSFSNSAYIKYFENELNDSDVINKITVKYNITKKGQSVRLCSPLNQIKSSSLIRCSIKIDDDNYIKLRDHKHIFMKKGIHTVIFKFINVLKNMSNFFKDCVDIIEIDLSDFNTDKIEYLSSFLSNCNQLVKIDGLANINLSKCKDLSNMFFNCENLIELDISNWCLDVCENMSFTFGNCKKLSNINTSNFCVTKINCIGNIFTNCCNLKQFTLKKNKADCLYSKLKNNRQLGTNMEINLID